MSLPPKSLPTLEDMCRSPLSEDWSPEDRIWADIGAVVETKKGRKGKETFG